MEYRRLGNTDLSISRLGFGCAAFSAHDYGSVDDEQLTDAVRQAIDHGINLFDVADVYGFGRAETLLAAALGGRRHQLVLATKCGLEWDRHGNVRPNGSSGHVRRAVEASLRRLEVESITLLQLHRLDPHVPWQVTIEAMQELRTDGKVRHLGISNVPVELIREITAEVRIEAVQVGYNLLCRRPEHGLLDCCEAHGISVLAHSSLARGFLSGNYESGHVFAGTDTRNASRYFSPRDAAAKERVLAALHEIAEARGCRPSAAAIRWVLDEPRIASALAGIKTPAQLKENLGSLGWSLASDQYARLCRLSAECEGSLNGELAGKELPHEVVSNRG